MDGITGNGIIQVRGNSLFTCLFICLFVCRYRFENATESDRFEFMSQDPELKTYTQVRIEYSRKPVYSVILCPSLVNRIRIEFS